MKESEKIWRYLDFTKFVSLLESRSLHLARLDSMGDPFEGSYPVNYLRNGQLHEMHQNEGHRYRLRAHIAISCWHQNDHESAAMWSLYLKSDEGVAIQSTVGNLVKELFANSPSDCSPGVMPVRYIDFEKDEPPLGYLGAASLKRKSFEHEREVRATLYKCNELDSIDGVSEVAPTGIDIPVNLSNLIENVYVSPAAPRWFFDLVKAVVDRFDCEFPVHQSGMTRHSPLY